MRKFSLIAVFGVLAGCQAGGQGGGQEELLACAKGEISTGEAGSPVPAVRRVVMVVLENHDAEQAMQQPFYSELAKAGAYLANSRAVARPSQPNYIALTAGGTHGVTSNGAYSLDVRHLGDLLEDQGKAWKVYAEGYPGGCFLGESSGPYARKHVPFLSFSNVQNDAARCARVVPADQFRSDIAAGALPDFSLYIPNNDSNGHDTDVAFSDRWLRATFGDLIQDEELMAETLFIFTFDEPSPQSSGPIYTAWVGAQVAPGAVSSRCYDHYSVLRTVEEALGLGNLGALDQAAAPISDIWKS